MYIAANLERMLTEQRASHEWSEFVDDTELIIKYGFVNKRKKGICTRRRMFLLTSTPRLIYIDPVSKTKKGEIPFDVSLTCERKNFRLFNLITVSNKNRHSDSDFNNPHLFYSLTEYTISKTAKEVRTNGAKQ
jgi:PH domain